MLTQSELHAVNEEMQRELDIRKVVFQNRINTGQLSRDTANLYTTRWIDATEYLNGRQPRFGSSVLACIEELKRELQLRQRLYPGWMASGLLGEGAARLQVERLQQAIEELQEHLPPDACRPPVQQGRLFFPLLLVLLCSLPAWAQQPAAVCKERGHVRPDEVLYRRLECTPYVVDHRDTSWIIHPPCNEAEFSCLRCNKQVQEVGEERRAVLWVRKEDKN